MAGVPTIEFKALTRTPLRLEMSTIHAQIESYIHDYLDGIRKVVQPYPPVPAGSRYKRTGALLRGWSISGTAFDQILRIDSVAGGATRQYAKYVHGDQEGNFQQWYHQGHGWQKLADHIDRSAYRAGLQRIYADARIQ